MNPNAPKIASSDQTGLDRTEGLHPKPSPKTRVTELPSALRYRFSLATETRWVMASPRIGTPLHQRFPRRLLCVAIGLLACSLPLLADRPSLLRRVPPAGCDCNCAASNVHGGCPKMCEFRRYASRSRATTCAKPRMHTPTRDSHAGPRFPHPRRFENALLWHQFSILSFSF